LAQLAKVEEQVAKAEVSQGLATPGQVPAGHMPLQAGNTPWTTVGSVVQLAAVMQVTAEAKQEQRALGLAWPQLWRVFKH